MKSIPDFNLIKKQNHIHRIEEYPFWSWIISKTWSNEAELLLAYKEESDGWCDSLNSMFEYLFSVKYWCLKKVPKLYANLAKSIYMTQVGPLKSDFESILIEFDQMRIPLFFHRPKLKRRTNEFFSSLDFLKNIIDYNSNNKTNLYDYSRYLKQNKLKESWNQFHLAKKYLNSDISRQIRRYELVCKR